MNRKVSNGVTKYLLKKFVPSTCQVKLFKEKRGFEVPIGEWIRGPLKQWSMDRIEENSLYHDLPFSKKDVKFLYEFNQKGKEMLLLFYGIY